MASNFGNLYERLFMSYKIGWPDTSGKLLQEKANNAWKAAKDTYKGNDFVNNIENMIKENNLRKTRRKAAFLSYFSKVETIKQSDGSNSSSQEKDKNKMEPPISDEVHDNLDESVDLEVLTRTYDTPAQTKLLAKIQAMESKFNGQLQSRNSGLGDICQKDIDKTKKELMELKQALKTKKLNAEYQKKHRNSIKRKLDERENNLEDSSFSLKRTPGRPRVEENQTELLNTIIAISSFGGSAQDRRRTEEIRTCKTLDDLHEKLLEMGFNLSRSATYLRLLPRKSNTLEGRKHVVTVPVKLCRSQTDSHKRHPDGQFCTSSIRYLESLASFLGPDQVCFLSQDDKARVPIGITAVQKQSPILMHVEYRIQLPDHDWVIAEKHKLIPSVYAGIMIKPNGWGSPDAVTYSGPTYIAIRSGKHSSSTAASHYNDFKKLLELECFEEIVKMKNEIKPVFIISVDGGPDENPRYPKTIGFAIRHFRDLNLDAFFIVTNAPGRSAFNRVERRMAPLSKELSGLILKHDVFGSHLDANGKTIDIDLERKNFSAAGNLLAEIWSDICIDNFPVTAEYIEPDGIQSELPEDVDPNWYAIHVRESQYLLQITKCNNIKCCGNLTSDIRYRLPDRFLPPPYLVHNFNGRITVPNPGEEPHKSIFLSLSDRLSLNIPLPYNQKFKEMPYDMYCPSVQAQVKDRMCLTCGLYFASKKAAAAHMKVLKHSLKYAKAKAKLVLTRREDELLCVTHDEKTGAEDVEWINEAEVELKVLENKKNLATDADDVLCFPHIQSIEEWLAPTWTT